jgi:RimJ/RimL family protein N-acetyltransferase
MDTEQTLGPKVDGPAAQPPGAVVLDGRFGRVERLDPARHRADLCRVMDGSVDLWFYTPYGPFRDASAVAAWLDEIGRHEDRVVYAILDRDGRALGLAALMNMQPKHRTIEMGQIVLSPALQRTPLATEAQYLLARYAFETLGYRRSEWKCTDRNEANGRRASTASSAGSRRIMSTRRGASG